MRFYKTITVTAKDYTEELAEEISKDDIRHQKADGQIIRLHSSTIMSYDFLCHSFTQPMWEAKYRSDFVYSKQFGTASLATTHFSVLIPNKIFRESTGRYHTDTGDMVKNSLYIRVEEIIKKLRPVGNTTRFDIYHYHLRDELLSHQPQYSYIWPFKKNWKWVGDGDYITVDLPPQGYIDDLKDMGRFEGSVLNSPQYKKVITKIEKICPLKVKYVNIDRRAGENTNDVIELMKHSKRHFTYKTGTIVLAGMMDIPTIIYGTNVKSMKHSGGYAGIGNHSNGVTYFTVNNLIENRKYLRPHKDNFDFGKMVKVPVRRSIWNVGHDRVLNPGRVNQLKVDSKTEQTAVIQEPQRYALHTKNEKELIEYIVGEKDVRVELIDV
tara:strand:- start:6535 stop:7677 length:1143 start_codon:yes stop_codon:yes gene_type:complete